MTERKIQHRSNHALPHLTEQSSSSQPYPAHRRESCRLSFERHIAQQRGAFESHVEVRSESVSGQEIPRRENVLHLIHCPNFPAFWFCCSHHLAGKFDDPSTHLSPPILAQATLAMSSEVPLTAYSRAHLEAMLSRPESVLLRESWAQIDLSRRAERLLVVTSFLWLTLTLDKLYLSQEVEINVELFLRLLPASAAAWCRRRLSRIREACTQQGSLNDPARSDQTVESTMIHPRLSSENALAYNRQSHRRPPLASATCVCLATKPHIPVKPLFDLSALVSSCRHPSTAQ